MYQQNFLELLSNNVQLILEIKIVLILSLTMTKQHQKKIELRFKMADI